MHSVCSFRIIILISKLCVVFYRILYCRHFWTEDYSGFYYINKVITISIITCCYIQLPCAERGQRTWRVDGRRTSTPAADAGAAPPRLGCLNYHPPLHSGSTACDAAGLPCCHSDRCPAASHVTGRCQLAVVAATVMLVVIHNVKICNLIFHNTKMNL